MHYLMHLIVLLWFYAKILNEMTEGVLGDLEQGITELQDSLRYNLAALKT